MTPPPLTVGPSSTVEVLEAGLYSSNDSPVPHETEAWRGRSPPLAPTTTTLRRLSTLGTDPCDIVPSALSLARNLCPHGPSACTKVPDGSCHAVSSPRSGPSCPVFAAERVVGVPPSMGTSHSRE